MFPLPQNPGDKQCPKCGVLVSPNWQFHSLDDGEIGWVGVSLCPSCGHKGLHVSGSPAFHSAVGSQLSQFKS